MDKKKRKPFIYNPHGEDKEYEENDGRPIEKRKSPYHVEMIFGIDDKGNLKSTGKLPIFFKDLSMSWKKLKKVLGIDD